MNLAEWGLAVAPLLWGLHLIWLLLCPRRRGPLLALGLTLLVLCTLTGLIGQHTLALPAALPLQGALDLQAQWLLLFGALIALPAVIRGTTTTHHRQWETGVVITLCGALGIFLVRDAVAFLIAWELMSLGGAVMLLGERLADRDDARGVLFMLGLLEVGSVALMAAFGWLTARAGGSTFDGFAAAAASLPMSGGIILGLLFLVGFGAKLGLLPFYEWFPGAYASGSGASGTLLSGVVLNAAFYGLSRALVAWVSNTMTISLVVVTIAVISAILAILYAFQENDWRELLSLSTAENAALATVALGAAMLFNGEAKPTLAALAWSVASIHLAAHALAKGTLFLGADVVYRASGDYRIAQHGWLAAAGPLFGLGMLCAVMSLAAMPPQAGFVSEWYLMQSLFHGFELPDMAARVTLALAGAGVALTVAIAFATFVKVMGVALLGRRDHEQTPDRPGAWLSSVGGLMVLVLGLGMAWWLESLEQAAAQRFLLPEALTLHQGALLIPLSSDFAFISPAKLAVVWLVLAIIPLALIGLAEHRFPVKRAPVWFGGFPGNGTRHATTALTFSNALRNFYSFIYRPRLETQSDHHPEQHYVLQRLSFDYRVAPLFGPSLFQPITRLFVGLAAVVARSQSGQMNLYLTFVGLLLVAILASSLL